MTSNWKASKTSLISQTNSEVFIEEGKDYNDWGRVQSPVNVGTEPNQRVQYHVNFQNSFLERRKRNLGMHALPKRMPEKSRMLSKMGNMPFLSR